MGKAMLTITAAFAQLERDTMIERTRGGLAAAAANGRKGGRPRKVDDAAAMKARSMREKRITATDIVKMWESPAPPCTATFPMAQVA
jgi:DNA invertase Pin-like site-specific DNA recombinase